MNIQSNNGYFYSSLLCKMFLLAKSNTGNYFIWVQDAFCAISVS